MRISVCNWGQVKDLDLRLEGSRLGLFGPAGSGRRDVLSSVLALRDVVLGRASPESLYLPNDPSAGPVELGIWTGAFSCSVAFDGNGLVSESVRDRGAATAFLENVVEPPSVLALPLPDRVAELMRKLDVRLGAMPGGRRGRGPDGWPVGVGRLALVLEGCLRALDSGGILVAREMDAFLHPFVLSSVLGMFVNPDWNPKGAKVLFSASGTDVLSGDMVGHEPLEPFEAGFVTRREKEGTEVALASSYELPEGADLRKLYLQGAFWGLPYPYA